MIKSRLPGINTVRKRLADRTIRTYYYHRESGRRLKGKPDTPEFVTSYSQAESLRQKRLEGTCAGLIREFLGSAEFNSDLAESTQKEYRRLLTVVEKKFGDVPVAVMADPRFGGDALAWRDEIAASKPREADNRMVVFARVLSWAKKRHLIAANCLDGYVRIHRANRAESIWLPEHVEAFQRAASPESWAVFFMALQTGLRQGDLRLLPWSAYDGHAISWRITKRRKGSAGVRVTIPCTIALRALLDQLPRNGPLILTTKTGLAWTKRHLARQFENARDVAARQFPEIAKLHFHDLRGTAITMLAEASASIPEIAAITGHSYRTINSILERYLPRTRHLAEMAISKLENSNRTDFANRLQTGGSVTTKGHRK